MTLQKQFQITSLLFKVRRFSGQGSTGNLLLLVIRHSSKVSNAHALFLVVFAGQYPSFSSFNSSLVTSSTNQCSESTLSTLATLLSLSGSLLPLMLLCFSFEIYFCIKITLTHLKSHRVSHNINIPHAPSPPLVAITTTLGCATTVGWLLLIYYIKLKSRLSVRLSVRTFLVEWISAVGAQINVKLARNEAPVFWADEVYF